MGFPIQAQFWELQVELVLCIGLLLSSAGGLEQAALRQIVQEIIEGMRQCTIPLPPVGAHRLRQTTGAVGVTTTATELADLGLQGASGGREGPSQIGAQAREL